MIFEILVLIALFLIAFNLAIISVTVFEMSEYEKENNNGTKNDNV